MPTATVPKKLRVNHAIRKEGIAASKKWFSKEKKHCISPSPASLNNREGASNAERMAAGTKLNQREIQGLSEREDRSHKGRARPAYVTTAMPPTKSTRIGIRFRGTFRFSGKHNRAHSGGDDSRDNDIPLRHAQKGQNGRCQTGENRDRELGFFREPWGQESYEHCRQRIVKTELGHVAQKRSEGCPQKAARDPGRMRGVVDAEGFGHATGLLIAAKREDWMAKLSSVISNPNKSLRHTGQ